MKIASTITVCLLLAAVLSRAISFSSVENRHGSEGQGGGGSGSGGRSTSNLGIRLKMGRGHSPHTMEYFTARAILALLTLSVLAHQEG
ncbi:hypothetical protein BDV33DRAFT_210667 [Aspergillus novoparasiticus]|uniref:Uncharacterized protein n=1 Tax=Aspergillus novoparasiticus TaxID=986946 RepID=A0A5N6E5W6_9EURO|nr:hypothetical protein BDV33DRAFT_210667 [Aspergillus novoparasiticus]